MLNSAIMRHVGNGFQIRMRDGSVLNCEGMLAAATDAGLLCCLGPGEPMAWRVISRAIHVIGPIDQATAIESGMAYALSPTLGVRTGAGISTLVDWSRAPIEGASKSKRGRKQTISQIPDLPPAPGGEHWTRGRRHHPRRAAPAVSPSRSGGALDASRPRFRTTDAAIFLVACSRRTSRGDAAASA
jgi:hypothetical protein